MPESVRLQAMVLMGACGGKHVSGVELFTRPSCSCGKSGRETALTRIAHTPRHEHQACAKCVHNELKNAAFSPWVECVVLALPEHAP